MEEKRFKCHICDKGFVNSTKLLRHRMIHTGEKPFRCDVCEKSFSQFATLRQHQQVHTGEKPFTCEVCDKSFSVSSTLRQHKHTHTGEKPFMCKICNKSFSWSSHLRRHQRIHTGEKAFKCEVCDKSFTRSSSLSGHRRLHTGEKPFTCEVCDKSFSQLSSLQRHRHTHTVEKPFPCKVNLARNTQEHSLTGGRIQYIKELTEQEGNISFTRKLFGLSNPRIINPRITNGGSDMGMREDTQVSLNTSDGDGGELAAVSEIPQRVGEEGTEVNTSQQCGMTSEVEEGEKCQEGKMSNLDGSVGEFKLNIVACVKEEACDAVAAVLERGYLEPSRGEELAALGAKALLSPRAHGQHQAFTTDEGNEDYLKPLECLLQEQAQSTESYQATSNLPQQTLTEFKKDVSQNLQRNNDALQHHLQRNNEILQLHLQRNNEILQQHLQRNNEIIQELLQRNNEIFQQRNVVHCRLLQRSNETLNEMRQILSQIVVLSFRINEKGG
ncbi:zinc finger protein 28-like isoform X1 [Scyliorhinus canicula]|uniref:zinc finger protein 28-like isoform X1 n=1 Tax=Scyliorhinus canicula TaxID=7830 RepID=UPI0018F5B516|nr:zinc finger protein 28-like isoform X1 [Scyliorhinus canicula]XP_038671885.1 zinc finger protein 28-like isoform X1 [Scyliorhinus canicula]